MHTEIVRFFDDFVEAFAAFDGKKVGSLFVAPAVALKRDGTLQGFSSVQEIEAYYQVALDQYQASGCKQCRYLDLETQPLNEKTATAITSWDLMRADGSVVTHWRQAYFLVRKNGNWRAYGSAFIAA
jgi:hypothetical protein